MFTIVISEKGGAERRETFEKPEIGVGRVHGNDLMLPKGNVSKQHARLLFRDARFLVTDLKSTNGTYVNGRKISQPTVVREGDKIYIGDFVLRVEGSARSASGEGSDAPASRPETPATPRASLPSIPDQSPQLSSASASEAPQPSLTGSLPVTPSPGAISGAPRLGEPPAVSHYPLERDPDSESAPELIGVAVPRVPGPPRVPRAAELIPRSAPPALLARPTGPAPAQGPSRRHVRAYSASAPSTVPRETPAQAARRVALTTLVGRVADAVDLSPLQGTPRVSDELRARIEHSAHDEAAAMQSEGHVDDDLDPDALVRDAVSELVGLGPLRPWLDDPEIAEIHISRPDSVLLRKGARFVLGDTCFTSWEAVSRALSRLLLRCGRELASADVFLDQDLTWSPLNSAPAEGGGPALRAPPMRLIAVGKPATPGWVVTIKKRQRTETTLEALVQEGASSSAMASFLTACVAARSNVLVASQAAESAAIVVSALSASAPPGGRLVLVQGDERDIVVSSAHTVSLWLGDSNAVDGLRAAARLGSERLVVAWMGARLAAATIDVIAEGAGGVLAGLSATSAKQALGRLVAHLALSRPGGTLEAARECVAESFDFILEVNATMSGPLRITRIAEIAGSDARAVVLRDLFVSSQSAGGDAEYSATGVVPRSAQEFAARGVTLDPGIFRRGT